MPVVFVFGTLKQGFPNFDKNKGVQIEGDYKTRRAYPCYLIGERYSPWLINAPGQGVQVYGELFDVDTAALDEMDRLERINQPDGYQRIIIEVENTQDGSAYEVFVYMKSNEHLTSEDIKLGPINHYTHSHAQLYRSRDG